MEKCAKVILSNRACNSIITDATDKGSIATGGILLGIKVDSILYVLESIDPGQNPVFTPASFEYDTLYVIHLAKVLSGQYAIELEVLGLWHYDPGNKDFFLNKNHGVNSKLKKINPGGAILGQIDIEPALRLTMYEVSISLEYTKVNFEVADHLIPDNLSKYKHADGIKMINLFQYCMPYVSWPIVPIF